MARKRGIGPAEMSRVLGNMRRVHEELHMKHEAELGKLTETRPPHKFRARPNASARVDMSRLRYVPKKKGARRAR